MKLRILGFIGAVVLFYGSAMSFADGVKVGGFVDAQYHWVKDAAHEGFTVNDGAVYLNADLAACSAVVDIPFRGNYTATSTTTPAMFELAGSKTQAYVSHKYDMGASWRLGQWDSPFGIDGNDTKDVALSRRNIVAENMLPTVFAGALLGFDVNKDMGVNFFVANQRNEASRRGKDAELGGRFWMNAGNFGFGAGGIYGKRSGTTAYLVDVTAKLSMDKLSVGAEFAMQKDDSIRTDASGMGIVGLVGFGVTVTMALNARVAYLSKATAVSTIGVSMDSSMALTVGPSFDMSKALRCKLDYTLRSDTVSVLGVSTSSSTHSAVIASVYSF
jgi:hypothetical protein